MFKGLGRHEQMQLIRHGQTQIMQKIIFEGKSEGWFNLSLGRSKMGKEQREKERIRCRRGKSDVGFEWENLWTVTQICWAGLWLEKYLLYRHLSLGCHYIIYSTCFCLCKKARFRSECHCLCLVLLQCCLHHCIIVLSSLSLLLSCCGCLHHCHRQVLTPSIAYSRYWYALSHVMS